METIPPPDVSDSVTLRLPRSILRRIDNYRDGKRPFPTRTKVIWKALEVFLKGEGL